MGKKFNGIRIVIADPRPIFRDGLRMLLEADKRYKVVGRTGSAAEAVKLTLQLKPDILFFDLSMPYHPRLEALRELARSSPQVRIITLTAVIGKDQILESLHLGARGVLMKESTTQLLRKSIRAVMSGQYWLGRESVSDLVGVRRGLRLVPGEERPGKSFGLSARELEVVVTVVAGYTNKNIAERLSISQQTVKHHLTNIFDKLGVFNRLELVLYATHHNLVGENYPLRTSVGANSFRENWDPELKLL